MRYSRPVQLTHAEDAALHDTGRARVAVLTISRSKRRPARRGRAVSEFESDADAVLDILELGEFAWHDCFGEVSP